jgi:hypothetical protein
MTAVVGFGMIAFFIYAPFSVEEYISTPMTPKNISRNIP